MAGSARSAKPTIRVGISRHFYKIQEIAQAGLAFLVVLTTCVGILLSFLKVDVAGFPPEWWTILGLVVGFYFGKVQYSTQKAEAETETEK